MRTNNTFNMMRHGLLLAVFCFLLPSCSEDEISIPDTSRNETGLCEATLRLTVSTFDQQGTAGTRSVQGNTDEDRIKDIVVLQYNVQTDSCMHAVYIDSEDFDSSDIQVGLKSNDTGEQSYVCIVANVHEELWALDEHDQVIKEFDTYTKLRNHSLLRNALDPFTSSSMGAQGNTIPMFGVSKAMAIVSKCYVSIPLERMFAKVRAYIDPSYITDFGLKLEGFSFDNIPYYSRIETISPGNDSEAAVYPDTISWHSYDTSELNGLNEVILYVPENLQGKVEGMTSKQDKATLGMIPEHAMKVILAVSDTTDATKQYTYTIYPGGDMDNDFNVKRNHIYNVNVSIKNKPE